jgi:hypothetical protein
MAYNLYPALLTGGVEFIGKSVYDGQTSFYNSRLAGSGECDSVMVPSPLPRV